MLRFFLTVNESRNAWRVILGERPGLNACKYLGKEGRISGHIEPTNEGGSMNVITTIRPLGKSDILTSVRAKYIHI